MNDSSEPVYKVRLRIGNANRDGFFSKMTRILGNTNCDGFLSKMN